MKKIPANCAGIFSNGSALKHRQDNKDPGRDELTDDGSFEQKQRGDYGAGINISASGNASKGSESGNGTQHNETTIDAGNNVTIHSGDDTTIAGSAGKRQQRAGVYSAV